ncbi:hypothetical protein [Robertmurraya sp. FSL R5-0851]|uniref:hypothetical protein n=1 Tax=Robertmurraya sp. FSL R5-0851 TaxID=2921584 RepID=UPI0030FCF0DE
MLKLVIDNKKEECPTHDLITCRNTCEYYDEKTEKCSIHLEVDVDSAYDAARCGFFLHKSMTLPESNSKIMNTRFTLIEEEADYLLDDPEIFREFVGKKVYKEMYTYPLEPDFSAFRDDAYWYISPCGTYGCWIVNLYQKPMVTPKDRESAKIGWTKKVYKSPIPLHNHKSSVPLASKVVWIVDEDGYGQYGLLANGQITSLSSPKPRNWAK